MRGVRTYIAFFVVMGGILVSSCDKQPIEVPNSTDPVFMAEGTIDGTAFNLVAGDNNAYMFTSIEDECGIPVFTGELSDGNFSIEMGLYDGLIDIPGHSAINSLPDNHMFSRAPSSVLAVLDKDVLPNVDVIDQVVWSVSGFASDSINTMTIREPGKYQVCASIDFLDGTSNVLCAELILGYERHANCNIKHFLSQNGKLTAWVEDPQVEIEKIEWILDNVLISDEAEFAYEELAAGNHLLKAQVYFVNGVKRTKTMIVDGDLSGKFIDDLSFFENSALALLHRDFNVKLKLEQNGVTYVSSNADNSFDSVSFDDVSYYGKDASGNSVYKVKAHVQATVADVQGANGSRALDFETTFGVAFPSE